jgi:hypothetical protein
LKPFDMQSYYELLEIPVSASADQIRRAYERLIEQYSDDQVALYGLAEPGQAKALRAKLAEALEILADDDLREMYDRDLGLPPRPRRVQEDEDTERQLAMNDLLQGADVQSTHPYVPFAYVPSPAPATTSVVPPPVHVAPPPMPGPLPTPAPAPAPIPAMTPPPPGASPLGALLSASLPPPAAAPVPAMTPPPPAVSPLATLLPPPAPSAPPPPPPLPATIGALAPPLPEPALSPPGLPPPPPPAPPPLPSAPLPPPSAPRPSSSAPRPRPSASMAPRLAETGAIAEAESQLAKVSQIAQAAREARASAPRPKPIDLPPDAEFNGELLRKVRTAAGLSLQQVSERTRISVRHLENVEADRYGSLPVGVYLRGILMNLSRELGLDGLKVSKSYMALVDAAKGKG